MGQMLWIIFLQVSFLICSPTAALQQQPVADTLVVVQTGQNNRVHIDSLLTDSIKRSSFKGEIIQHGEQNQVELLENKTEQRNTNNNIIKINQAGNSNSVRINNTLIIIHK